MIDKTFSPKTADEIKALIEDLDGDDIKIYKNNSLC